MRQIFFPLCFLCVSFGFSQDSLLNFQWDAPDTNTIKTLELWATEYYAHVTKSNGTIPYLTMEGDSLGLYSDTCNFCTACLEGTVIIEDSTGRKHVLNYAGRATSALVNCRSCSKFSKSTLNVPSWGSVRWKRSSGFGEGVNGYQLIPYRTVAVDPNYIPYGSVLYIPEAVGTKIESVDGTSFLHDGYFFAGDTGGAIKENHIDVFTGIDASHPFDFVKSTPKHTVRVYRIDTAEATNAMETLHTAR